MAVGSGQDLVNLLARLKCPAAEDLHGDDLDWIWETGDADSRDFLEWLVNPGLNLSADANVLTDEELELWAEFQANHPERVLHGQRF